MILLLVAYDALLIPTWLLSVLLAQSALLNGSLRSVDSRMAVQHGVVACRLIVCLIRRGSWYA